MAERTEKKYEPQEAPPEKGWASFLIRIRQEVVEKANDLIKTKPEEEAIVLAEVDMLDGILKEIGETKPDGRRQLIENFWQEKKIPEDIYKKLAGRMEAETELEKLAKEAGLGAKEKITEQGAAQAVGKETEEVVQKNPFWSRFREKVAGKIKVPEIWQKLKEKKIFGRTLPAFLTGLGTGAVVRYTTRFGLGFLTGGAGYLLGTLSGAVSGGVLEGVKAYKKEMGRERAALSEEEFEQKVKELHGKKIKEKLESYLEIAKIKESQIWSEEKDKLRKELEKKLKSKDARKAFWGGAWKGAAIGAFGGFVGSYLSDLAGQYFAPEKAAEAAKAAREAGGETLKRELETAASDAYAKTYEKTLAAGLAALKEKTFEASAEKGEGATHVARKLIHDYITQNRSLGQEIRLEKGELIYAEDALRRTFEEGAVRPGDTFTATGDDIAKILEKTKALSGDKIKNLEEVFAPKIKLETWGEMTTYNFVENPANDFAGDILKQAGDSAAEAAQKGAAEAAQLLKQSFSPEAIKAKDSWLLSFFKSILGKK